MPLPWNHWYHITLHTYGSWLRGDPRGWRARHHTVHVEGDYKHPPPAGTYTRLHARSKSLMTRDPVRIPSSLRQLVANSLADKLLADNIQVLVISTDSCHAHLLARIPDHNPRHWIGRAKKHTSHVLRQLGLRPSDGGLFSKRSHPTPITTRAHQLATFRYILSHATNGAAIWRFNPAPNSHQINP